MRNVLATELVIEQQDAKKELDRIIKQMIITRIFKRTYEIKDVLLLYVPYAVVEFEVKNVGRTKRAKAMEHVFISMELASGRMKSFADIAGFEPEMMELEDEQVAYQTPNLENINEAARKEMLFKVLPKNLKTWKEYDMEIVETRIVYRPLWLMRYQIFGKKMRLYKRFGDCFNL